SRGDVALSHLRLVRVSHLPCRAALPDLLVSRLLFFLLLPLPPRSTLFPYTTLFRSEDSQVRTCHSPANAICRCSAVSASKYSCDHSSISSSDSNSVWRILMPSENRTVSLRSNVMGIRGEHSSENNCCNAKALS